MTLHDATPVHRFIKRSDGKWTYAVVKSFEETAEGKSAIRFTVSDENSSKSYNKKYWGTHVRPLKISKPKPLPPPEREGRTKQREPAKNNHDDSNNENNGRSRSRRRSVSASPMRTLTSIVETEADEENDDER